MFPFVSIILKPWLQTGYGLDIGLIDPLYTPFGTTGNCNAVANFHSSQITEAPSKPFQSAVPSPAVPQQRLLSVEILQLPSLRFFLHRLSYRTAFQLSRCHLFLDNPSVDSESESYITTDDQSASLSWNKAPIWGLRPCFCYRQIVVGLLTWGVVSDERTGPSFRIAAGPRQRSHSRVLIPWDSHIRNIYFRRLLRLAGLRWRYSTLPPQGIILQSKSKSK
jgi:hypothetical protein